MAGAYVAMEQDDPATHNGGPFGQLYSATTGTLATALGADGGRHSDLCLSGAYNTQVWHYV